MPAACRLWNSIHESNNNGHDCQIFPSPDHGKDDGILGWFWNLRWARGAFFSRTCHHENGKLQFGPFDYPYGLCPWIHFNFFLQEQKTTIAGTNEASQRVEESIITEGLISGAIQVPGNGKPVINLTELVTGGNTKIAAVISTDLPNVAQRRFFNR